MLHQNMRCEQSGGRASDHSLALIAKDLAIGESFLRNWLTRADRDDNLPSQVAPRDA
jgi:hypothetical protein